MIYGAFSTGGVNGWRYWWTQQLVPNASSPPPQVYAPGNFSKFVRPGYYRIDVSNAPKPSSSAPLVVAFTNLQDGTVAIVVVNGGGAQNVGAAGRREIRSLLVGFGYAWGLNRSRRELGAVLLAAVALAAAPRIANGATDTVVRLEYQADEQAGCVGEDELRRMVTDQLGHDPFSADADRRLAITLTRTEAGFQGRIVWTEADGRRLGERLVTSRSRDCREIASNVAFAVVLQLQLVERGALDAADDGQSAGPPTAADESNRAAPTVPPPNPSTEAPAAVGQASTTPLQLAVGAGPALGIGMTPDATAFGRLFVAARFGALSAELAADAALPVTLHEPDGTGVVVNALGSTAAGCGHISFASACLLGRLGWIRARGTGVALPSTGWGHFGEVGMRLAASRELGRFIVGVHADGLVMLTRWNVVLNDAVVWSVPRVGAVVGADVALLFF